jgi:hypothetical protein
VGRRLIDALGHLVSRIVDSLPFPRQLLAPDQEVHRHEYEANQ